MVERILMGPGGATETTLGQVLTELGQKLEAGQAVALTPEVIDLLRLVTFSDPNGVPYSAVNPVPVDIGGAVTVENLTVQYQSVTSTLNVPAAPLAADEVFVGTWEDVRDYAAMNIAVHTDVSSATNGAVLEFSHDGVNVVASQASTVAGGYPVFFSVAPQARYVRVRYTNGPAPQTFLRVELKYAFNPPAVTQAPAGAPLTDLNAVQVTKAALTGRVADGPYAGWWLPIATDGLGRLLVDSPALTDGQLRASPLPVEAQDSGEREYAHAVATVTTLGSTTVLTPTAGKAIRLRWLYAVQNPTSGVSPLIRVLLGGTELYRAWALSKRQVVTGPVDGALVVNLSTAGDVAVTVIYEEV